MRRLLIANRGEIARRIERTAHTMGIETVAVFAAADQQLPFVREADQAVPISSYLDGEAIVAAAQRVRADAVHPGYGFLSENAGFAQACVDAGLVWIGPAPAAMHAIGDKARARSLAEQLGVPLLPGYHGDDQSLERLLDEGQRIGFPVLIKASAGGGGRGMRVARSSQSFAEALETARREASAAFGDPGVFIERCLEGARHVEVQILGDQHGHLVHLFDRDCSIQRRHQKLIEEAPAPLLPDDVRERLRCAALDLARAINYSSAGTVEFLVKDDTIAFLEMNTRLQVEHPVTEATTGLDLVRLQIEIARGEPLPFDQAALRQDGHAIEARLYAEDPANGFLPAVGRVHRFFLAEAPGIRCDSGIESGTEISSDFDGLLAKVAAHGPTRAEALSRLVRSLRAARVHGVRTNRNALVAILDSTPFHCAETATDFLEQHPELLTPTVPDDVARAHALAAALVLRHRRQATAQVLRFVPPGWRNMPIEAPGPGARALDIGDTWVDLETDGLQARYSVHSAGDVHYVNGRGYQTEQRMESRFPSVDDAGSAGGTTAPLPGKVVAVLVQPGERVHAGQTLVILDAMKIEHRIAAESDGVVLEVRVSSGERVDAHQLLVVLGP